MQPGTILAGRYRVGRTLGAGAMGVIVEGTHLELGTSVAIKILHDRLARDPERVQRFLREARAAAQLRGEHICRVHDFGMLPDGEPFMVMELLSGCDLAALVDQRGPLSPASVVSYAKQACAGVAEAHAVGIVHRDLKPTNIFRTHRPDGGPLIKILDFGIAKLINGQDLSLTQTSTVMGSPKYMSPEQLKSSRITDPRCDIWALGVVMYELLTGAPPFSGETVTELALNITNDPVPPLPDKLPEGLIAIVMRCLEKDPAKRYPSVAELGAALDALPMLREPSVPGVPETPREPSVPGAPRAPSEPSLSGVLQSLEPSVPIDAVGSASLPAHVPIRRKWPFVAAAVVLIGAVAIYVVARGRDEPAAPETRSAIPVAAPVDAAPVPIDAAAEDASEPAVAVDAAVDAGVPERGEDTRKRPRHRQAPGTSKQRPGDLGKSRY